MDPVNTWWRLVVLEAFAKQVRKSQVNSARLVIPGCAGRGRRGLSGAVRGEGAGSEPQACPGCLPWGLDANFGGGAGAWQGSDICIRAHWERSQTGYTSKVSFPQPCF